MPTFEKPPAALVERFETVIGRVTAEPARAGAPEITRRPMFGHPCAWVGGNMATGLFADKWWVRLSPDRLSEVLGSGEATTFSVMPGRAMQGYAVMSPSRVADDSAVDAWVREALAYTATMPPKQPKAKAKGTTVGGGRRPPLSRAS